MIRVRAGDPLSELGLDPIRSEAAPPLEHRYDVRPVAMVSPVDPQKISRTVGFRAICWCGWSGLTRSVPGKHWAAASIAMAHVDGDTHLREAVAAMSQPMLELHVWTDDGRSKMERRERDDDTYRGSMERSAFARIADPRVTFVQVRKVTRYAGGKRGASR